MFIRQTRTANKITGEAYFTFRLVRGERIGGRVRQITVLKLGRNFAELGINGVQRAAILGNLIGRMAVPGSERATWEWLQTHSALAELLEVGLRCDVAHELVPCQRLVDASSLGHRGSSVWRRSDPLWVRPDRHPL